MIPPAMLSQPMTVMGVKEQHHAPPWNAATPLEPIYGCLVVAQPPMSNQQLLVSARKNQDCLSRDHGRISTKQLTQLTAINP